MEDYFYQRIAGRMAAAGYMRNEAYRKDFKYWRDADMLSDTNTLERPFTCNLLLRAKNIELTGGLLVWQPDDKAGPYAEPRRSDVGVLNKFVRLCGKNSTPEDILSFAREWGVIGICSHLKPFPHYANSMIRKPCGYSVFHPGKYSEDIALWRKYSRQARAILRIASQIHQGKQGDFEDWRVLKHTLKSPLERSRQTFIVERACLAQRIEFWLELGEVHLSFKWVESGPSVRFNCNLLGLIACHLMFAVSRSQGIAICTSCGYPYPPRKRTSPGRGNYCDYCKTKAPSRESRAARRRRESR